MILTDREIAIALQCKQLIIDPDPSPESIASTSVDLTLSEDGLIWEPPPAIQIFPGANDYKFSAIAKSFQKPVKVKDIILKTNNFLLSWTKETIELPITSRLGARVEGKSSIARLGIGIHLTAPTISTGPTPR